MYEALNIDENKKEKFYITTELWGGVYFTSRTMKQSNLPPLNYSKPFKSPLGGFYGGFATVTMVQLR